MTMEDVIENAKEKAVMTGGILGISIVGLLPVAALGTLLLTHRPEKNWPEHLKEQPKIEKVIETKPSAIAIKAGPSMEATVTGYKQKSQTLLELGAELYLGVFALLGVASLIAEGIIDGGLSLDLTTTAAFIGTPIVTGIAVVGNMALAGMGVIPSQPSLAFYYRLKNPNGKEEFVQVNTRQPPLKIGEKIEVTPTPVWITNGKFKEKVIMDSINPVEQTTVKKRNSESNTKHPKISYLRTGVSDVVPTTVPTAVSFALRQMRTENTLYNLATNRSLSRTVS